MSDSNQMKRFVEKKVMNNFWRCCGISSNLEASANIITYLLTYLLLREYAWQVSDTP